eukprot:scaffold149535_cov20-Tisochrysis_lutea.AAC.2
MKRMMSKRKGMGAREREGDIGRGCRADKTDVSCVLPWIPSQPWLALMHHALSLSPIIPDHEHDCPEATTSNMAF